MINLTGTIAKSDYISDCKDIIAAAKSAIAARDKEIQDQNTAIHDLESSLELSKSQTADAEIALTKWYHNPVVMTVLGIVVGGAGGVYLSHK